MSGELPKGWAGARFRDAMRLEERREPIDPNRTYKLLGVRWYGNGAFLREERLGEGLSAQHIYRVQPGDVIYNRLFAWKGSFGLVGEDLVGCYVSNEFPLFAARLDRVDPQFLLRVLQHPRTSDRADAFSTGTTSISRNRLGEDDFLHFPLNLPPLAEQRGIAEVLGAVETAIAKTEALIDVLGVAKNAILEECLVHGFKDRHAKKGGRNLLPQGWEHHRLRDVAAIRTGISKSKERHISRPLEVPYLRVANVQDGYLDLGEVKTITIEQSQIDRYSLRRGDVLFNEGGDFDKLGRGCVWSGEIEPCVHQNHVFVVRCKPNLAPEFLALLAASRKGKAYFRLSSKQTTNLASINTSDLRSFPVLLPSMEEQLEIAAIAQSFDERGATERRVLGELKQARAALAQELLSGRLRLPASIIARHQSKAGRAA
jgi:type I restriction enzyme S subunit